MLKEFLARRFPAAYEQRDIPPPSFFERQVDHTPDRFKLDNSEYQFVFDYGHQLPHAPICAAFTNQKFTMWVNKNRPIILKNPTDLQLPRAKVHGILYLVPSEKVIDLDKMKQNLVHFRRKQMQILLPFQDRNGNIPSLPAWSYLPVADHWNKQIDWDQSFYKRRGGLDFIPIRRPYEDARHWVGQYYYFSPRPGKPRDQFEECHLGIRNYDQQQMIKLIDKQLQEAHNNKPIKPAVKEGAVSQLSVQR